VERPKTPDNSHHDDGALPGADDRSFRPQPQEENPPERTGGPPHKKKKNRGSTDDPDDEQDPNYLAPELVWWYTECLPNRWRGCRTWMDLCDAACDGTGVHCLAEGCDRSWLLGSDWDMNTCLMSCWSHMHSKAGTEHGWDKEDQTHATKTMMTQFLACYKREQLVGMEKELEKLQAEGGGPSSSSSSSSGDIEGLVGENLEGDDDQDFHPPANVYQNMAGVPGRWRTQGGWGGSTGARF